MKVSTLRKVDRWAGTSLTIVLTLLRKISGLFSTRPAAPAKSLLFVKLAEQGSTVLAYGALRRAVELYGREHVYFLAFEENRFIVDVLEVIPKENVITIHATSLLSAVFSSLKAVRRMRALKIDAAIDLEFFARASAVFTYLSGASQRVGFHSYTGDGPYRGDLMTHRLVYNPHLHTCQVFHVMVDALQQPPELLPALGLKAPPLGEIPRPALTVSPEELEEVKAIVCEVTRQESVPPLVLLNANCSDLLPLRKWGNENYISLAQRLLEKYPDLCIGFTGAPSEKDAVESLVAQIGSDRCVSFAGKTTLRQLLVVYSVSRVLVTNDSGPAHFATLTPIQAITLFGPETPKLFAAPSPRSHIVWAETVCSPCVNAYNNRLSKCQNNLCMQRIPVDQVFEKTCDVFERDTSPSPATG